MRYEPVDNDGDPVSVHAAELKLTDEQAAILAAQVVANLTAKADAGARLFFALYHHPRAVELFKDDGFMTLGLRKAYLAAQRVYLP